MKKLPKGRVMLAMTDPQFLVLNDGDKILKLRSPHDTAPDYSPVAVIPCATQREARAIVRLHAMSQQQLEDLMLVETERQENASDEGWEPGRIDLVQGFLAALNLNPRKP